MKKFPPNWHLYHTGLLAKDRIASNKNWRERERAQELSATADYWYTEYVAGKVKLVQHRIGYSCYEYYAVRMAA